MKVDFWLLRQFGQSRLIISTRDVVNNETTIFFKHWFCEKELTYRLYNFHHELQ